MLLLSRNKNVAVVVAVVVAAVVAVALVIVAAVSCRLSSLFQLRASIQF